MMFWIRPQARHTPLSRWIPFPSLRVGSSLAPTLPYQNLPFLYNPCIQYKSQIIGSPSFLLQSDFKQMSISAISLPSLQGSATLGPLPSLSISTPPTANLSGTCFQGLVLARKNEKGFVVRASSNDRVTMPLTGFVFHPFEEVKRDELAVPIVPDASIARQNYSPECESAINEQINVEYCVSYAYHALYAYFDRDNVALKGLAKFFKEASLEEREHAEKLMEYQNARGGRVKLLSLQMPPAEFDHAEKGDALHAMELTLSLEKLTNDKLLKLHSVADSNNDAQLADFIESEFLGEQVEAIKKISEYISQLRRVGKGHGVWHFDQMLLHEGEGAV